MARRKKSLKESKNRNDFLDEVHKTIVESNCYCFGAQVHKPALQERGILENKDQIYKICFLHILSAVNSFLKFENINESVTVFIDRVDAANKKSLCCI